MKHETPRHSRVWDCAQLLVRFFRAKSGDRLTEPFDWPLAEKPAFLNRDPTDREAIVRLTSHDRENPRDVTMKMHTDEIQLERASGPGWTGIGIFESGVDIKVGDTLIRVLSDGSVAQFVDGSMTFIEHDGGVLKTTDFAQASISSDMMEMVHRTPFEIAVIDPDGARVGPRPFDV